LSKYPIGAIAIAGIVFFFVGNSTEKASEIQPGRKPGPVIVELFTSQGCSSCPAADRLLTRLGMNDLKNQIIPLSYHVDYWNYLGWQDPFASSSFTQRQYRYGEAFALNSVYTPQVVLNGQFECVGSSETEIRSNVRRISEMPARASLRIGNLVSIRDSVRATVFVSRDADLLEETLGVITVVYENGLITHVARGENGGRELRNDFVVRHHNVVKKLDPAVAEDAVPINIFLDSAWVRDNLGVVVYVQNLDHLQIYTAQTILRPAEK